MTACKRAPNRNRAYGSSGFTLIELMIVLAIVGIIAGLAIPAYSDYVVRSRVSESTYLVSEAKLFLTDELDSAADLAANAASWNAQVGGAGSRTKYVNSVQINGLTGQITMIFNQANVGSIPANASLVYTPYVQTAGGALTQLGAALAANQMGIVLWGCASDANTVGVARGMPALNLGTLPATFAPKDCR